jgi:hypothetical protein
MAKYTVSIGKPFAVDAIEIDDIEAVERLATIDECRATARHQARITYGVLGFMSLAIVTTAIIGWYDGSYDELNAVWGAGGIWVGLVLGRYFKKD